MAPAIERQAAALPRRCLLAAGNPQGSFYANDFNPSHVAQAARMAATAQLDNLTLLEHSFEELAHGCAELPQLDFITMHGVYTWVNEENRQHIVRFIDRYLKPGGVVYVSYNAMPGWSAALPLQRLVMSYRDLYPNRSDLQIQGTNTLLDVLESTHAAYLTDNPSLSARTASLRSANPQYLVHEYMHRHWQPLYYADVARDFSRAKMTFAGSADLPFAFPALYLDEEKQALLAQINNPETRETLQDYLLNTSFRKDVFVRGASRIGTIRQAELLEQVGLALAVPRAAATSEIKLSRVEFSGDPALYNAVLDTLATRPHTLGGLAKLPILARPGVQELSQIAVLLCASNQSELYFSNAQTFDDAAARRLNDVLAAQVLYGDEYAALCSPLLGSGMNANLVERLFYQNAVSTPGDPDPSAMARHAWQTMLPVRRQMLRAGTALSADIDSLPALKTLAANFVADKFPVWRQLRIL